MKGAGIVILKKNGNVSNKKLNKHDNIIDALYSISDKRIKMSDKPVKLYSFSVTNATLEIYGYINGKAGQENSHDLPPNATCYCDGFDKSDTDLLYGEAYAIKYSDDKIQDFEIEEYAKHYSKLFGGFEDLGDEDEYSEDELENVDPKLLTSQGYFKDDFVVSDKDQDQIDDSPPDTPITLKKADTIMKKVIKAKESSKASAKTKGKKGAGKKAVVEEEESQTDESMSELGEETYMFSDED